MNPFFSRRIGLSDTGDQQKILYGTKATGQLGGQDVGVLHVRTGAQYDFLRYQVNWRTANRRKVAFEGRYEAGDFYSGKRDELVANVTFRVCQASSSTPRPS